MKQRIKNVFITLANLESWKHLPGRLVVDFKSAIRIVYHFSCFFILLVSFMISEVFNFTERLPLIGRVSRKINSVWQTKVKIFYDRFVSSLEKNRTSEVKRSYLINLAFRNLLIKKTRSFITMLGMSVGVGIIVLLLSLGYGIEKLVIGKIASLNEIKIIDVTAGSTTALRLSKDVLQKINKLPNVDYVLPVVSVVGRVSYNKATSDILVYAVSTHYLKMSNIKFQRGKMFEEEATSYKNDYSQKVAGYQTEMSVAAKGETISGYNVNFNVVGLEAASAWKGCSVTSEFVGYVPRIEGGYVGMEYWGGQFAPFEGNGRAASDANAGGYLGRWVKSKVPIYSKNSEDDSLRPVLDENGRQVWEEVCLPERNIEVESTYSFGSVLGEATGSSSLLASLNTATDSAGSYDVVTVASAAGGLEFVELKSSATTNTKETEKAIPFTQKPKAEAVVSSGMLNLLNIPAKDALNAKFNVSFIVVKSLMPEIASRAYSEETEYKIIGVIEDDTAAHFYVPLSDLQKIGIQNFSQAKVVLKNKESVEKAGSEIRSMGFRTASTFDTVKQVESLFANLRVVLGILGLVALAVASLGMFNTLTVSLLERTREIGGMKTMGMVSDEIRDLFLAEAMIMGLGGGIGGLILGYLVGKFISLIVSLFALVNGQGFLNLTYVPGFLIIFILFSSFVVGVLTGLYPAWRAKKISALNALRYE